MERPGLARLITDIRTGKIDTVVVYKVDRLTRSLSDFAKLIELFEDRGVSFVSVTQQFNTTTSMGRLMLNVLLSFAQFEREVTGERIRDKVAASKKKGMWMGGMPPIGYEVKDKKLIVSPAEAKTVRHIFRRYAELGCVSKLTRDLEAAGYLTKRHTSASGRVTGGLRFARGHLYGILANRLYLGQVVHKDESYPGEHDAIIDRELWDKVHAVMKANRRAFRKDERTVSPSLLKGIVFDDAGNRMSPSHSQKEGRRYRYYISQAILQDCTEEAGSLPRLPAHNLEHLVVRAVLDLLKGIPKMRPQVARIEKLG